MAYHQQTVDTADNGVQQENPVGSFLNETHASLNQLKQNSPDPLVRNRTEQLMRQMKFFEEMKMPLDRAYTLEELNVFLTPLWSNIDFGQLGVESSDIEVFKQVSSQSLSEISFFLQEASLSPDIHGPRSDEYMQQLFSDIEGNIEHIWQENLKDLWNENIGFTDFMDALFYSGIQESSKNPEYLSLMKQDFLKRGGTEEGWEEFKKEGQERLKGQGSEYEQDLKTSGAEWENNKNMMKEGRSQYADIFGITKDTLKFDGTETADDYIKSTAHWILTDATPGGRYEYLTNGGEPFYEVIQFVQQGGTGTISPEAYQALQSMLKGESRTKKHSTWIDNQVSKLSKYAGKKDKADALLKKQKKIGTSDHTYQMAMLEIAKAAQQKMGKAETHAAVIEGVNTVEEAAALQNHAFADGYEVKNKHTDSADGSWGAQSLGRFTFENLLLDQVLRSAGLLMVIANVMVGFRSGNWGAVAPYIAAGGAVTYGLAQGVLNSGLDKMRYPDKMLNNIVMESFDNNDYPEYFGNPWEMAFAKAISWPNDTAGKKQMRDKMKGIKTERNDNLETISDPNSPTGKRKLGNTPLTQDRDIRNKLSENISIEQFGENCDMAEYLGKGPFLGPDGTMYPREEFLKMVNDNGVSGEVRYTMMNKTVKRINRKDSYLPYLNQLHHYYSEHFHNTKSVSDNLAKLKTEVHGHG